MVGRLFLILIYGLLVYGIYLLLRKYFSPTHRELRDVGGIKKDDDGSTIVECFTCSTFLPDTRALRVKEGPKTIFFCSEKCMGTATPESDDDAESDNGNDEDPTIH